LLGLVGIVFAFIPIIGVVAWPLVVLGIVLSALGYARIHKGVATNKGLTVAGIILSVIGLVICILYLAVFSATVNAVNQQSAPTQVSYTLTGTGHPQITYDSWDNSGMSTSSASNVILPWTKTETLSGLFKTADVQAVLGPDGGTVTCTITESGKTLKTSTGSGAFGTVDCNADLTN
jgi:hypothetical protein